MPITGTSTPLNQGKKGLFTHHIIQIPTTSEGWTNFF